MHELEAGTVPIIYDESPKDGMQKKGTNVLEGFISMEDGLHLSQGPSSKGSGPATRGVGLGSSGESGQQN
jgi:hypothetical protein